MEKIWHEIDTASAAMKKEVIAPLKKVRIIMKISLSLLNYFSSIIFFNPISILISFHMIKINQTIF